MMAWAHHTCIFVSGREHPGVHGPRGRDAVIIGLAAGSMNPGVGGKGLCICPAVFGWVGTGKRRNPRADDPGRQFCCTWSFGSWDCESECWYPGVEMPSPSRERVPAMHGAESSISQNWLNLGAGSWNAAAHIRLLYLMSEIERVGGSTQEDPRGADTAHPESVQVPQHSVAC